MRHSLVICFVILAIQIHPFAVASSRAAGDIDQKALRLAAGFDGPEPLAGLGGLLVERKGGQSISDGLSKGALGLAVGEYLALDARKVVEPREGTISFWVRPHWDEGDTGSHTFLSFSWKDQRQGYFTLTEGWWEPDGAPFTYLVFNNQDHSYVHGRVRYARGEWMHFAVTWKVGENGYVRFFVNGIASLGDAKAPRMAYAPDDRLYFGSDQGTPLARGRWADCDLDELAVFDRALDHEQILSLYEEHLRPDRFNDPSRGSGSGHFFALFDEGTGWMTPEGARETIQRVSKAGFNTYVPCVWHGRGTRYPSQKAPPESGAHFGREDPLALLIDVARKKGIRVHPWFTVALRQRDFLEEYYDGGTPKNAFDLQRPGFRKFIVDLILDAVERYELDGINLDYIRTMGLCRCEFCQKRYKAAFGRNLLVDAGSTKRDGTLEPHVQQWVDGAVRDIVKEVSRRARAMKPGLVISVDGRPTPHPNPEGRQEIQWANEGLVDVIYNMEYGAYPEAENHHLMKGRLLDPSKLVMLLPNYEFVDGKLTPREASRVARMVRYARTRWQDGVGLYFYTTLSDEQVQTLPRDGFGTNSSVRPLKSSIQARKP